MSLTPKENLGSGERALSAATGLAGWGAAAQEDVTMRISNAARQSLHVDDLDLSKEMLSISSPTNLIRSTIFDYVEENGFTYHRYREGKYLLPNDKVEQERLNLQHELFLLTFSNKLYLAPLRDDVRHVMDLGTGTGIWAIDFATSHPSAEVIGTDLSPIQPDFLPPNCHFEVSDAEDEWKYNSKFDFIHGRALVTCFQDPTSVIAKAYNAIASGGFLEFQDLIFPTRGIDDTYKDCASEKMAFAIMEAAKKLGKDFTHSARYKTYFENAGFVDVVESHFQWPIGTWPKGEKLKAMGAYFRQDLGQNIEAMAMALLTRGGGMGAEDVRQWAAEAKNNIYDPKVHAYMPGLVVYGRKP